MHDYGGGAKKLEARSWKLEARRKKKAISFWPLAFSKKAKS